MKQRVMTVFILLEEAGGLWVGPNNLGVSTWTRFFFVESLHLFLPAPKYYCSSRDFKSTH